MSISKNGHKKKRISKERRHIQLSQLQNYSWNQVVHEMARRLEKKKILQSGFGQKALSLEDTVKNTGKKEEGEILDKKKRKRKRGKIKKKKSPKKSHWKKVKNLVFHD